MCVMNAYVMLKCCVLCVDISAAFHGTNVRDIYYTCSRMFDLMTISSFSKIPRSVLFATKRTREQSFRNYISLVLAPCRLLKRSPGIIRKSRVSYPGPGFPSSATWPSLPKKHYNGLNKQTT